MKDNCEEKKDATKTFFFFQKLYFFKKVLDFNKKKYNFQITSTNHWKKEDEKMQRIEIKKYFFFSFYKKTLIRLV